MYINRVTNKSDIVIGIPVLNRRNAAEKNTAGMFVSTVPFRITLENDLSYKEFSDKVTRNWLSVLNFDYLKDLFYAKEIEFIHDHQLRL